IVITYDDSPEVFDILFVRGDHVEEYAGLHHDLRTLLSEESVKMELAACGMRCRVYLFSVSQQGFDRFRRTFHTVPSVNVVIDRLSRKQLSSLLIGSGCKNGILEIDRPSHPFPLIVLNRFHSAEELLKEASRFRQGRMIVYDLELNTLIRQRRESIIGGPAAHEGGPAAVNAVESTPADPGEADSEPRENTGPGASLPVAPPEASSDTDLAAAFRSALTDFLSVVAGLHGGTLRKKMEGILNRYFPHPGIFNPALVTHLNATCVLELIEEFVRLERFDRRARVRERGREIVKYLYDSNHELLRKRGVEEKVQSCYLRLGE
ncbi:MAG TPA: hypothetical protein VF514_08495, partial [Bacteroidota bacterium]